MARPLGDELSQLRLTGCAEPDEQSRIQELQAGSEEAFDWLVSTYAPLVYRLAYRLLNQPADAGDVAQDVFLKVFRGVGTFEGHCSLKTWVYHITVNTVWNQNRWWRRHREQERPLEIHDDDFGTAPMDVIDESPSPLQDVLTLEAQELVRKALGRLSQSQRLILVLREMEELNYDEVAAILEVTEGTVKSRLARARLALKRELEGIMEPALGTAPAWHMAK
jgi:RNA polymerase sigma-70 factor (ECF subfamily)